MSDPVGGPENLEGSPRYVPFTNQDGSRLIEFTSVEWDAYWHGIDSEAALLLSRLRDE